VRSAPVPVRRKRRLDAITSVIEPWRKTLILGGVALALIAVEVGGCQRDAPPQPSFVPLVIQPFSGDGSAGPDTSGGSSVDPGTVPAGNDVGGAGVRPADRASPTPPSAN